MAEFDWEGVFGPSFSAAERCDSCDQPLYAEDALPAIAQAAYIGQEKANASMEGLTDLYARVAALENKVRVRDEDDGAVLDAHMTLLGVLARSATTTEQRLDRLESRSGFFRRLVRRAVLWSLTSGLSSVML